MAKKQIPKEGNRWIVINCYDSSVVDSFLAETELYAIKKINDIVRKSDLDWDEIEIIRGTKFTLEVGAIELVKEK